jgi:hypothetical protein
MWDGIIRRFLKQNKTSVFIYYLHEYAYGRLFSYILSDYSEIKTIGMQHGPARYVKSFISYPKMNTLIQGTFLDPYLFQKMFWLKIIIQKGYTSTTVTGM